MSESLDPRYGESPLRVFMDYHEFKVKVLRQMCRSLGVQLSQIVPKETLRIEYLPTARGGP